MSKIKVDCCGETCPIPLIETRKAIRKASLGDIIEVKNGKNGVRLHDFTFYFSIFILHFVSL